VESKVWLVNDRDEESPGGVHLTPVDFVLQFFSVSILIMRESDILGIVG
jgi:hypothetical protein